MVTNQQAIEAFRILLPYVETANIQATAALKLLVERGLVSQHDADTATEAARAAQRAKWTQLRTEITAALKEQADI
jgi:hypothetical protein